LLNVDCGHWPSAAAKKLAFEPLIIFKNQIALAIDNYRHYGKSAPPPLQTQE